MKHVCQTITIQITAEVPDDCTEEDLLEADTQGRYTVHRFKRVVDELGLVGIGQLEGVKNISTSRHVRTTFEQKTEDAMFEVISA